MEAEEPSQDTEGVEQELTLDQALLFGRELVARGQFETGASVCSRILEVAPGHPDALNLLAIATCQLGERKQALEFSRRAAVAAPDHAGIHNNLGNMLMENGDVDGATEAYRRSAQLDPAQPEPLSNLGLIAKARGDYDEAETLLKRALELNPEHGPAHHSLGEMLAKTGRRKEAIDHLWRALLHMQSHPYLVALAYDWLGEREAATKILREWVKNDPDNIEAKFYLSSFSGEGVPARADDQMVEQVFDRFANSFESLLTHLEYKAPQLVAAALLAAAGPPRSELTIIDAGCGTGLCAPLLRAHARHLCGVDLSSGMLEKARATKLYDELAKGELTAFLGGKNAAYDAIVSADTLCYFGKLEGFADAAARALAAGGRLIFTIEALDDTAADEYRLAVTGRYKHSGAYVDRVLSNAGFEIVARSAETLRLEGLEPVAGFVVSARRA